MRVTLDIQAALGDSRVRGIGKYSLEFLEAIAALGTIDISCVGSTDKENFLYSGNLENITRLNFLSYQLPQTQSTDAEKQHLLQSEALRRFYTGLDSDIIHISSLYETLPQYMAWGPQLQNGDFSHLSNTVVSATFYDAIPMIYPEHYLPTPTMRRLNEFAKKVYSKLDLLFAISESARQDAITYFHLSPEQIVNIGSAAGDFYKKLPADDKLLNEIREKLNSSFKKMLLYTGGGDFRKNHMGLMNALKQLPEDLRQNTILVIAGHIPEELKNSLMASNSNASPMQIIFTGWVTDEELRVLYNLANLFIFPSLYEGFGLPVLEAMKCGTPVIVSNTSSLPEVLDLQEAQFDPLNTQQMAERIIQGLTDQQYCNRLIEYGVERQKIFSWERVAETAVSAWTNALSEKKKRAVKIYDMSSPKAPLDKSVGELIHQFAEELNIGEIPFYEVTLPNVPPEVESKVIENPGILLFKCTNDHPEKSDIYAHRSLFTQKTIFVESDAVRQKLYCFFPNHADNQIYILPENPEKRNQAVFLAVKQFAACRDMLTPLKFKEKAGRDISEIPECLFNTIAYPIKRRLLVDLTMFYQINARSGIQRVVRQITEHLLADHADWEVIPFALTMSGYYPLKYQDEKLIREPAPLVVAKYDLLLMLDSSWGEIGGFEALFNAIKQNSGSIFFMVYDLIPLLLGETCNPESHMPIIFDRWFRSAVQYADQLICISKAVADQCAEYIKKNDLLRSEQILYIDSFVLGSDIPIVKSEESIRKSVQNIFTAPSSLRFLTVGTIEARKNHALALQIFSELWKNGYDFSWYILGKHGWKTEIFDELLQENYSERGKHLFIFNNPSDAEIQYAYRHSDALIFPSIGEGFGLPLVEASHFGVPLLCSDLPVFREICGKNACYLDINSPTKMYRQIEEWIQKGDKSRLAAPIWPYTWQDSADDLLRSITHRNPRYVIKKAGTTYMDLHHNF